MILINYIVNNNNNNNNRILNFNCRVWGSVCLLLAFVWQFYTVILLLRLHESVPGIRYSRFLFLAMAAFGTYNIVYLYMSVRPKTKV